MSKLEIGLYTLGDYISDAKTGHKITEAERMEEILAAARLADEVGLDVFSVGESHQEHFISQAHALILAAIARETKSIRISSSATILSTSDPVRVYENFATVDILSKGRAELVAGRASRIGLFSLLGYDVRDYDALFEEKFELLLKLNREERITWQGKYRAALTDAVLYPKPLQASLPIWRAVGGTPQSAYAAGRQGVPMMLATLAGPVSRFNQAVTAYRETFAEYHEGRPKVGITSFFHVGETDEAAFKNFYSYVNHTMRYVNGAGFSKEVYRSVLDIRNAMLVGSVDTIVEKLVYQYKTYKHDRHLLQMDLGGMPYDVIERSIPLIAKEIIPRVNAAISDAEDRS